MLYVSALTISAKKALGTNNCFQTTFGNIIKQLQIDPKTSGMNEVLLGPNDLTGQNKEKLMEALEAGIHPGILLMYIYQKESQKQGLNIHYAKGVSKIKPANIKDFVTECREDFLNNAGELELDVEALTDDKVEELNSEEETEETVKSEIAQDTTTYKEEEKTEEVPVPPMKFDGEEDKVNIIFDKQEAPVEKGEETLKREKMLESIRSFEDWTLLKEALEKDSITKELITENAEYNGAMQMLDVLDQKIHAIYFDSAYTADEKFNKIREIGLQKSELRSVSNSISAQKIIGIIDSITQCAKRVIEERLEGINSAMAKLMMDKGAITDTSKLDSAIQERTDLHLELIEMLGNLYNLYNSMDGTVKEAVTGLDENLPSNNAFINNMVKPMDTSIFTPLNTSKLATGLLDALQKNRITLSAVEDSITGIINLMYSMYESDKDLQDYYQNMVLLLKAQNVEDVVIVDCVLKNVLHVYVGAADTGRTATALTWSGILSRRKNTLLIDITGESHYDRYGVKPMDLSDFLVQRIEQDFLVVKSDRKLNPEEIGEMLREVKNRLNYYCYVNVVVDCEDKVAIDMLGTEARTLNYITDCSLRSINAMRECVMSTNLENIGQKLIIRDAPVNPLHIAESLNADPTRIKLVMLPNISTIRACALRSDKPYEHKEVVSVFEEAFR